MKDRAWVELRMKDMILPADERWCPTIQKWIPCTVSVGYTMRNIFSPDTVIRRDMDGKRYEAK